MIEFEENSILVPRENPELSPAEIAAFIKEIFAFDRADLEACYPYRIRAAYRLVRELGRIKGIIHDWQTLEEGMSFAPVSGEDPWYAPVTADVAAPDGRLHGFVTIQQAKIPIMPPKRPRGHNGDYKPEEDKVLLLWLKCMTMIARKLNITRTHEGRLGFKGLLDPNLCQDIFPIPAVLIAWERQLLASVLQAQVDQGVFTGQRAFQTEHSLTFAEAKRLSEIALQATLTLVPSDVNQQRAIQILQLEGFERRAREGDDLRAELAAMKLRAEITQVRKADVRDVYGDVIDVMREVSSESEKEVKELPEPPDKD